MLISRSTGWAFEECNSPATALVEAAFAAIKEAQDQRGLHQPSQIPDEAARMLDEAAQSFEELKFWFDFTKEWEYGNPNNQFHDLEDKKEFTRKVTEWLCWSLFDNIMDSVDATRKFKEDRQDGAHVDLLACIKFDTRHKGITLQVDWVKAPCS